MDELRYHKELSRCVRCGACKATCPTYLTALSEPMGARGRITILGELEQKRLHPTRSLSEKIFSCILCEACKDLCPAGINIPEIIYSGRARLKNSYIKGRILAILLKLSISRLDTTFSILRGIQKLLYGSFHKKEMFRYLTMISPRPFKKQFQVYKGTKKINRVALFVGCNVNYLYPRLGNALVNILLTKGYEVVVSRGEVCCGAPMKSLGLNQEASLLARKNVELFNKMRVEAILSMCPTCTLVIKHYYPTLVGETITNIMDVNEFFIKHDITKGLRAIPSLVTYHDPCHLRYGLGIKTEPREILKSIEGIRFVEMHNSQECCGFGGFFSLFFKDLSKDIGRKKIDNIYNTWANTVVTSCPGCITQLEGLKREMNLNINIMHIVEVINEAMHG